jgi:putative nucleotidyltransferase with HDIG domain
MVKTIEAKDPYTKNHSERVTAYSCLLGEKYGLTAPEMRILYYAALLHDIGKIGVPDDILKKQGKLLPEEYALIKKHPEYGAEIIRDIKFLRSASDIILHHHERWDGLGYPFGLKGDKIPLLSRVIAIADTFDAITSDRSYRKGRSFEKAFLIISEERGKQFDPILANAFLSIEENILKKYRDNPDILGLYKKLFE